MDNVDSVYNASVAMSLGGEVAGTIGAISTALIDANIGLRAGDQLTFVIVGTKGLSINGNDISFNGADGFEFIYKAFVLDTASATQISSLGFEYDNSASGCAIHLELPFKGQNAAVGGCVIVTRSNAGKIDASNTALTLNAYATSIYEKMRSEDYRAIAELSYKASENAVLDPMTTAEAQNA